jgi:UDP-glucose 4-epimerase
MAESVLVTGGAGYVGSHVVVELAQAGYAPVVLDDYSNSTPAVRTRLEALAGRPVPCINADVRDVVALRAAFHDHPIAAIVHCAGLKVVSESEERPLAYYDVNVGGTLALVEVMGEAGVATLVYTSSAAIYGQPSSARVDEEAPLAAASVYGRNVRVVEDFLRDLARANVNWRIAILRAFTAAARTVRACSAPRRADGRAISSPCWPAPRPGRAARSRCTATTGPPRTAPPCATTCMSRISRGCTSPR